LLLRGTVANHVLLFFGREGPEISAPNKTPNTLSPLETARRSTTVAALERARDQSQFNERQMVQAIVNHATTIAANRMNSILIFP